MAKSRSPASSRLGAFARQYAGDYEGFCRLLEIVGKDGKRVPFRWKASQRRYHEQRSARDVVLKGRRIGFTTGEVARDFWHLMTREGARVTIVVQSISGHTALFDVLGILQVMLESVEKHLGCPIAFEKKTAGEWHLADRDAKLRIVEAGASRAAASKKGRAGNITRLHCTELAFWEHGGETLNALLRCVPKASTGSEIIFESTPNGASSEDRQNVKDASGASLFHWNCEDARAGTSGYRFHFFAWYDDEDCTEDAPPGAAVSATTDREKQLVSRGITASQLAWYRAQVRDSGQQAVDQEFPSDPDTCFLLSGRSFFEPRITEQLFGGCFDPVVTPILRDGASGEVRIFYRPTAGEDYVLTLDPSEGTGGDPGVGVMLERRTGRHMATITGQFRPWELAIEAVGLAKQYGWATIVVERQNHGHTVLRALVAEQNYPRSRIFADIDGKFGWNNTEPSRNAALAAIEKAHREGAWKPVDRLVLLDVRSFVVSPRGKAEAAPGAHDDLVMAEAIGWDVICRATRTRYELSSLPEY